jgi:hypothetical protein
LESIHVDLLPHEMKKRVRSSCSKQEKSNPSVWQTRLSSFVDSDVSQMYHRQSMMKLLLRSRDVCIEDRLEPQ